MNGTERYDEGQYVACGVCNQREPVEKVGDATRWLLRHECNLDTETDRSGGEGDA